MMYEKCIENGINLFEYADEHLDLILKAFCIPNLPYRVFGSHLHGPFYMYIYICSSKDRMSRSDLFGRY